MHMCHQSIESLGLQGGKITAENFITNVKGHTVTFLSV